MLCFEVRGISTHPVVPPCKLPAATRKSHVSQFLCLPGLWAGPGGHETGREVINSPSQDGGGEPVASY